MYLSIDIDPKKIDCNQHPSKKIIVDVETIEINTSRRSAEDEAPVRIPRDNSSLEHLQIKGLYKT